ncbi:MAG: aspartate carbamoyltransferase regulatory subunit [Deltaproteobacteria bacterium]|nr:MAG: aspartate carbamoyltransferase regulatory subunit [Deltaproteobacteria bacterium]
MTEDRARKVYAIDRGTVIDHIPSPLALKVVEILGVKQEGILTIGINFKSAKLGSKDIVKVENLKLTESVTDRLALVAPTATINIIEQGRVVEKRPIHIPREFHGLLRCPNPKCITNVEEVTTVFHLEGEPPHPAVRCHYCERLYKNPGELVE